MTAATYIIGAPGSGKSTRMARLIEPWSVGPYVRLTKRELFGHYLAGPGGSLGVYLGHLRDEYPGTDALSLSVAPQALLWVQALPLLGLDVVYGEGVRLAHIGFLTALNEVTDLTVLHMLVDPEVAAARRLARGGKQLSDHYCRIATSRALNAAQACREAGIKVVEETSGMG